MLSLNSQLIWFSSCRGLNGIFIAFTALFTSANMLSALFQTVKYKKYPICSSFLFLSRFLCCKNCIFSISSPFEIYYYLRILFLLANQAQRLSLSLSGSVAICYSVIRMRFYSSADWLRALSLYFPFVHRRCLEYFFCTVALNDSFKSEELNGIIIMEKTTNQTAKKWSDKYLVKRKFMGFGALDGDVRRTFPHGFSSVISVFVR